MFGVADPDDESNTDHFEAEFNDIPATGDLGDQFMEFTDEPQKAMKEILKDVIPKFKKESAKEPEVEQEELDFFIAPEMVKPLEPEPPESESEAGYLDGGNGVEEETSTAELKPIQTKVSSYAKHKQAVASVQTGFRMAPVKGKPPTEVVQDNDADDFDGYGGFGEEEEEEEKEGSGFSDAELDHLELATLERRSVGAASKEQPDEAYLLRLAAAIERKRTAVPTSQVTDGLFHESGAQVSSVHAIKSFQMSRVRSAASVAEPPPHASHTPGYLEIIPFGSADEHDPAGRLEVDASSAPASPSANMGGVDISTDKMQSISTLGQSQVSNEPEMDDLAARRRRSLELAFGAGYIDSDAPAVLDGNGTRGDGVNTCNFLGNCECPDCRDEEF